MMIILEITRIRKGATPRFGHQPMERTVIELTEEF